MRKATTTTPARKPRSTSVQRSTGFFGPARGPGFFTPVLRKSADVRAMQTAPTVSRPGNALERQADRVADQVIRMPGAPTTPARRDDAPPVQRLAEGPPADAAGLQSTTEGRHLLAHELTHTIQQGATVARAVRPEPAAPTVQRLGLSDALDWFAGKAAMIPGFRMLTLVIGFNPINGRSVDRTAGNFLRALIELVPGGSLITQALDNHGVINSAASWVERKVAALGDIGAAIVAGLNRFIDSLGVTDILSPGDVWDRAKRIVTDPVSRLIDFGSGVVGELLDLVKQAILRPLAALAASTRGYDLLKAILGRDPITGAPYPRTAETLIGGFMKLIGQDEVWENLKRGKAVQRAYAWFQGALTELLGFVRAVPARIVETLRSLTFPDVVSIVGAFRKVGSAFLGIAGEFGSWAGRQVLSLLEILVSVVAPGVMPYIAKARTAFHTIVKDPVRFVGHLVRAGRLGFQRFADNILEHLKTSLIRWLVGPLAEAGVYIPKSFSLLEIVKLMVSVLGLTWQNIRAKLLRIIPEPVLQGLEKTAAVLVTLATDGPAAAWEQIKAELSELKDQLVGQVTQMIRTEIVKAAVTKLVTMLNPAGAVVQAIVAIWNTVSFFVEKIQQIGAVVAAFVDSIAAIAAGQVEPAAKRVEQTMANTLTLVIGFLAKFAGLGGIPVKLVGVVRAIRAPVDRALDKIVAWLGALLQKIVGAAKAAARKFLEWWRKKVPIAGGSEPHTLTFQGERRSATLVVQSEPTGPVPFLKDAAKAANKTDTESGPAVGTAEKKVADIVPLQVELQKIDDNSAAAASGPSRDTANTTATKLDARMADLGGHIGTTLVTWGVGDEEVRYTVEDQPDNELEIATATPKWDKDLRIERGGFTESQKRAVAQEVETHDPERAHLLTTARRDGEDIGNINVQKGTARRHVVSAGDMRQHYMKVLHKMKASAAKLLIEERGSIPAAREHKVTARPITADAVRKAAVARYSGFFGYAKNIFLGDSKENSSIQEHLDEGNPKLAGEKLWEHVDRIKRAWALNQDFTPSRKEKP